MATEHLSVATLPLEQREQLNTYALHTLRGYLARLQITTTISENGTRSTLHISLFQYEYRLV